MTDKITTRLIVVPIIRDNKNHILLCKMPEDRGVFPGQWGLPGGGVESGENIYEALEREIREELGVSVFKVAPLFFKDGWHEKTFPTGEKSLIYMVFLLFDCEIIRDQEISLNSEFSEFAWVEIPMLPNYDLNSATRKTFIQLGML